MSEVLEVHTQASEQPRRRSADSEQTNSPGTVYESGRRRREEILDAATKLFGEYAYNGVSMRDVAAATGVTHAGLRYHFPSKDDLLLAVLERHSDMGDEYYDRALACAQQTPPDLWGVIGEFTSYLRFSLSQRLKAQMFIMHAILASDETHAAHGFFERRYLLIRQQFSEVIALLQSQGFMREDLNVDETATEIIAMMDGLQVQWLITPQNVPYRPIIEEAVRRLLRDEHKARFDEVIADVELPGGN